MKIFIALGLMAFALLSSCADEKMYMSFPHVEYITEFPENIQLERINYRDIVVVL